MTNVWTFTKLQVPVYSLVIWHLRGVYMMKIIYHNCPFEHPILRKQLYINIEVLTDHRTMLWYSI